MQQKPFRLLLVNINATWMEAWLHCSITDLPAVRYKCEYLLCVLIGCRWLTTFLFLLATNWMSRCCVSIDRLGGVFSIQCAKYKKKIEETWDTVLKQRLLKLCNSNEVETKRQLMWQYFKSMKYLQKSCRFFFLALGALQKVNKFLAK